MNRVKKSKTHARRSKSAESDQTSDPKEAELLELEVLSGTTFWDDASNMLQISTKPEKRANEVSNRSLDQYDRLKAYSTTLKTAAFWAAHPIKPVRQI